MNKPAIINFVLKVDGENPHQPVVASEIDGPTCIEIWPIEKVTIENGVPTKKYEFRVAFEPQNIERRKQPYRENVAPIFPDDKKYPDSL